MARTMANGTDPKPLKVLGFMNLGEPPQTGSSHLPRLGSRVRIPSPAPAKVTQIQLVMGRYQDPPPGTFVPLGPDRVPFLGGCRRLVAVFGDFWRTQGRFSPMAGQGDWQLRIAAPAPPVRRSFQLFLQPTWHPDGTLRRPHCGLGWGTSLMPVDGPAPV